MENNYPNPDRVFTSEFLRKTADNATAASVYVQLKDGEYPFYQIYEVDELGDPDAGYGLTPPEYCARHYTTKDWNNIYFLHEIYEDIKARRSEQELTAFIEITKRKGVNMFPYIESYLNQQP